MLPDFASFPLLRPNAFSIGSLQIPLGLQPFGKEGADGIQ